MTYRFFILSEKLKRLLDFKLKLESVRIDEIHFNLIFNKGNLFACFGAFDLHLANTKINLHIYNT